MGYFTLASNVAMAISPSIGLYIIAQYSFQAASLLSSGLLLLGLVFSLLSNIVDRKTRSANKKSSFVREDCNPPLNHYLFCHDYLWRRK